MNTSDTAIRHIEKAIKHLEKVNRCRVNQVLGLKIAQMTQTLKDELKKLHRTGGVNVSSF